VSRWLEDAGRCDVRRGVLPAKEAPRTHRAAVEGKPPALHCLLELLSQFRGLPGPDHRPEVQLREGIIRTLDSQRVAEAQAFDDWHVRIEECGQQASLDDIPRVRSAPLLGVFEPLAQMLGEQLPLGEVPYPPRVQPFLLEKGGAAPRPLDGPPTTASAPTRGLLIRASPSFPPIPLSSVTGRPARAMKAWASVRQWKPPWLGVFGTPALAGS